MLAKRTPLFLATTCLLAALGVQGCGEKTPPASQAQQDKQRQIDQYVAEWLPRLRHDMPDITMSPAGPATARKILVAGEFVAQTEAELHDVRIILPSVLAASQPPAEIDYQVRFRLAE